VPSLYEFAGGEEVLHRLEDTFYSSVLADPLLQPLFGAGKPEHVDHLTAFTAESFGGPDRFSRELGFGHLIEVQRHLGITEEQRKRFVQLYMEALDASDLPDDEESVRRSDLTLSSAQRWQCRTPMRNPRTSFTHYARFPGGLGLVIARELEESDLDAGFANP
jgi:truncated hemoglobin YjbI